MLIGGGKLWPQQHAVRCESHTGWRWNESRFQRWVVWGAAGVPGASPQAGYECRAFDAKQIQRSGPALESRKQIRMVSEQRFGSSALGTTKQRQEQATGDVKSGMVNATTLLIENYSIRIYLSILTGGWWGIKILKVSFNALID